MKKRGGSRIESGLNVTRGGSVSAADVLHAVVELAPDGAATAEILALLNIERVALQRVVTGESTQRLGITGDTRLTPPLRTPLPSPERTRSVTEELRAAARPRGEGRPTITTLESTAGSDAPPAWLESVLPLKDDGETTPIPVAPIFAIGRARSILAASVSMRSADGPIAIRKLVEMLSRLEPVREMPRRPMATLRRGVQLLVDRWGGMEPYAQDVATVVDMIERVVGSPRTQVLWCSGAPLREVTTMSGALESWRPPARGTPVVIVSDLGIGGNLRTTGRTPVREWITLARRARGVGCPVIALVPFGEERWHPELVRAITHIHWDHRMTAGDVRRAIGPGHIVR